MKLYEINEELEKAFNSAIDCETGEIIDEDAYADFCQFQMDREAKIENIGLWYKNVLAEAEAIKAEKEKLAMRQRAAENKAASLKEYLSYALGGESFKAARLEVRYRKSNVVDIKDSALIPEKYLTYSEPKPDKRAIGQALKSGEIIPGAGMIEKQNILIK